jgi:hypothetical protein
VSVTFDGELQTFTDADGGEVFPLIRYGTTYLPVRAVADLAGLGVGWDAETRTVILTSPPMGAPGSDDDEAGEGYAGYDEADEAEEAPVYGPYYEAEEEALADDEPEPETVAALPEPEPVVPAIFAPEPAVTPPTATPTAQNLGGAPDSTLVWLSATGSRWHAVNNCGTMNPARARQVTLGYARSRGFEPCNNCSAPR